MKPYLISSAIVCGKRWHNYNNLIISGDELQDPFLKILYVPDNRIFKVRDLEGFMAIFGTLPDYSIIQDFDKGLLKL
jgi:hypothetical protein